MLPHSYLARSELFCYKAIPIKLENLRDSCCVKVTLGASPISLHEGILHGI